MKNSFEKNKTMKNSFEKKNNENSINKLEKNKCTH